MRIVTTSVLDINKNEQRWERSYVSKDSNLNHTHFEFCFKNK